MDLELYDCCHCQTFGVLPTSDGQCPHCRHRLAAEDKQGAHPPDWAPCPTRLSLEEERQRETRRRVISLCAIVFGVAALLASPAMYVWLAIKHGGWTKIAERLSSSRPYNDLPGALAGTGARAVFFLLLGWALVEAGFLAIRPRRPPRLLLYPFVVAMLVWIGLLSVLAHIIDMFSHMGP